MSETLPSLTANGQKLIDRLLTLPQGWVTAAMLAESIGVSRRTVLRELPSVEQWIAAAGYRFVSLGTFIHVTLHKDHAGRLRDIGKIVCQSLL